MKPDNSMSRVVGGKRYSLKTATLLAHDAYWDGSNFERHGRNTFLYRTRGGAFFAVYLTQWEGERDTLQPLSREDAMSLYEDLQEHVVEYEQAFDTVVEEASAGRPPIYDQPMTQTAIWLPNEMYQWLQSKGNVSEYIRGLIKIEMGK